MLAVAWLGNKWGIPAFQKQNLFWIAAFRAAILLFPLLLIWPRGILNQPMQLIVAIGLSILVFGFSHMMLSFYFPRDSNSKEIRKWIK